MRKIQVTGGILHVGLGVEVKLSEKQASLRSHALDKLQNGNYRAKQLLHFKAGEILSIDEVDIPKSMLGYVDFLDEAGAKSKKNSDRRRGASENNQRGKNLGNNEKKDGKNETASSSPDDKKADGKGSSENPPDDQKTQEQGSQKNTN